MFVVKSKYDKEFNRYFREAKKYSNASKCAICGCEMDSSCHSHTIPKFILRGLQHNGKLYSSVMGSSFEFNLDVFPKEPGLKNTFIFRMICGKCDNVFFSKIEEPRTFFAEYGDAEYNRFAVKSLLRELYTKFVNTNYLNMIASDYETYELYGRSIPYFYDVLELSSEVSQYIDAYKKSADIKNKVIIDAIVPYNMGISCITHITPKFSYNGVKVNDVDNIDKFSDIFGQVFISILPYQNQTRILFFYRKKYSQYDVIKSEFDQMEINKKINSLIFMLLINSESFVYGDDIKDRIKDYSSIVDANIQNDIGYDQYMKLKKSYEEDVFLSGVNC